MLKVLNIQKHPQLIIVGAFLFIGLAVQAAGPATGSAPTAIPVVDPYAVSVNAIKQSMQQDGQQMQQQGAQQPFVLGPYRTEKGTVKLDQLILNRYKDSVVRVITRDQAGNELSRAMGVSVGKDGNVYIATPLSLILGNAMQWADLVEITHSKGNKYQADIAYINEELDLVLLAPKNLPSPVPFVREQDERTLSNVYIISFEDNKEQTGKLETQIHKSELAAVNKLKGTMSVAGDKLENKNAGTAVINMAGELMGILLPDGNGVLSSAMNAAIQKAKKTRPFPPRMVGVIMGRGVLVDPKLPFAYHSIADAIEAIQTKKAPRIFPELYIPSANPQTASRVVLKVMAGTFSESNLKIPPNVSLTGSGPNATTIINKSPKLPLILVQNVKNSSISNLRLVPSPLQEPNMPTLDIKNSSMIYVLGNIIESNGGTALNFDSSKNIAVFGNSFPQGKVKAIACKNSSMIAQANSFLGNWPQAIAADTGCRPDIKRNLFVQNQISIAISGSADLTSIANNTFIESVAGIKVFGTPNTLKVDNNIFYKNMAAINSNRDLNPKLIGKNAAFGSKILIQGKEIKNSNLELSKVEFQAPESYDFRIKANSSLVSQEDENAEDHMDYGAYQRKDYLGNFTSQFIKTLEVTSHQKGLAATWGYK